MAFFNKNRVSWGDVSQRCVPPGIPKICLVDFLAKHTKSIEIGECVGVRGNYSISKLKLCLNLTYAQTKIESSSSLDSRQKNTLKIRLDRLN